MFTTRILNSSDMMGEFPRSRALGRIGIWTQVSDTTPYGYYFKKWKEITTNNNQSWSLKIPIPHPSFREHPLFLNEWHAIFYPRSGRSWYLSWLVQAATKKEGPKTKWLVYHGNLLLIGLEAGVQKTGCQQGGILVRTLWGVVCHLVVAPSHCMGQGALWGSFRQATGFIHEGSTLLITFPMFQFLLSYRG